MPLLVASFLTYAWTAGEHVNIAGIVIALFFAGLSVMLIYASTLAYLVDSNPVSRPDMEYLVSADVPQGRAGAAVSSNSFVRGSLACVMSQVAAPIQDAIGDGGLYTLFAGLLALSSLGILFVACKPVAHTSHKMLGRMLNQGRSRGSHPRVGQEVEKVEVHYH